MITYFACSLSEKVITLRLRFPVSWLLLNMTMHSHTAYVVTYGYGSSISSSEIITFRIFLETTGVEGDASSSLKPAPTRKRELVEELNRSFT